MSCSATAACGENMIFCLTVAPTLVQQCLEKIEEEEGEEEE